MRYRFAHIAMLFACLILMGCSQPAEGVAEESRVPQPDPRTRTEVPLVRSIDLAHAGELVDIEFDLPPPNRNAADTLSIGMRIDRPRGGVGVELADRLIRAGIQSQVRLSRLDAGEKQSIPLSRVSQDHREHILVPERGEIPGLTTTSVEETDLQTAGLFDPDAYYTLLAFAEARGIQPGRYKLNVVLNSDQAEFQDEKIDLLVAYVKRGK